MLGSRADVPEVIQESLAKAWQALSRGKRPGDPVAWFFVIVLNTARDFRRRGLRSPTRKSLEDVGPMELPTVEPNPTRGLEQSEALRAARSAIHALNEREREVFLLRTSAGLTYEATAEALGIPVGTAKTRMRQALLRLRAALAEHAPEDFSRNGHSKRRQAPEVQQ